MKPGKLNRDFYDQLYHVEQELRRSTVDPETRNEVEDDLSDAYREMAALESDKAFENHLAKYLTEQYKQRRAGERDEPLCSCPLATCPLTEGEVPPAVRTRGGQLFNHRDTEDLVSEYLQDHRGAEVLHEVLETWNSREGELYRTISSILARLMDEQQIEGIA